MHPNCMSKARHVLALHPDKVVGAEVASHSQPQLQPVLQSQILVTDSSEIAKSCLVLTSWSIMHVQPY